MISKISFLNLEFPKLDCLRKLLIRFCIGRSVEFPRFREFCVKDCPELKGSSAILHYQCRICLTPLGSKDGSRTHHLMPVQVGVSACTFRCRWDSLTWRKMQIVGMDGLDESVGFLRLRSTDCKSVRSFHPSTSSTCTCEFENNRWSISY